MSSWKTVSRSAVSYHIIWYNGSGPPPVSIPSCTTPTSITELMMELSKNGPDIADDRVRLVCDCREPARIEPVVRELLQHLRDSVAASSIKLLLFGHTDQTLANGNNLYVSADLDFLDHFAAFRATLLGSKSLEMKLAVSKRRNPIFNSRTDEGSPPSDQAPSSPPVQDMPTVPAPVPEPARSSPPGPPLSTSRSNLGISTSASTPHTPQTPFLSGTTTPLELSLGSSGGLRGFAYSNAPVPITKPLFMRTSSTPKLASNKQKFIGTTETMVFDNAQLKEYLRGLRQTAESTPLLLKDDSQIHYFFEELGQSPALTDLHLLLSSEHLWPTTKLIDAFKGNRSLRTLHLSGQFPPARQISAMGFDQMLGVETANHCLSNLRSMAARLGILTCRCKTLTTLRLVGYKGANTFITALLRPALEASFSLTSLSFSGTELASAKNSPLKKLASYSIFKVLGRRSCLITELDLSDCGMLTEELEMSLQLLSKNVSLTMLDVSGNGILNVGAVTQVFRTHPSLINLHYMQGNTGIAGKRSELPVLRTRGDLSSHIPSLLLVWGSGPSGGSGISMDVSATGEEELVSVGNKTALPKLPTLRSSQKSATAATVSTAVSATGEEEFISVGNATVSYTKTETDCSASDVVLVASPAAVEFWLHSRATFNHVCSLTISSANLVQLPQPIADMPRLIILDVSCNLLEDVSVLSHTPLLVKLFARGNSLTKVPPSLARLRTMDLSNNYIRRANFTASAFPALRRLSLRENPLSNMSGLESLMDLRRLDIEWCKMEFLPLEMRRMTALTQLRINGCPVAAALPESTDPRQLLAHLDVIEREAQAFPVMKVLVLGDEGVGKTSVAKGLAQVAKRSVCTTSETDAMSITECTFDSDKFRVPPRLMLWDFGVRGNDALSLTTSFFITERTLYLLVFKLTDCTIPSRSEAQLEFWLSSVAARVVSSQKAPVFLIGTHADQCSHAAIEAVRERISQQLLPSYPSITGFHVVSSKDAKHSKGYQELLPRLLDTLKTKRLIGFTVPPSWLQVITAMRLPLVQRTLRIHASLDYCSWSTFQMLAERLGVTEGFEQLIGFLNERGIVAYMGRDERNPLRDWVFISPTWLLTATRKLFTGNLKFVRKGRLLPNDVSQLWGQLPDAGSQLLLKVLQYFEIIYHVQEEDATQSRYYLVPHLLEADAPDCSILWPSHDEKQATFQHQFALATLPVGLMSRILIRMTRSAKVRLAWQNGMILQYADQFAYIVLLPRDKLLRVTVRRPRAITGGVPLLNTCVEVVDALCTKWFSVRVTRLVTCSHCLTLPAAHPHDFKLADLELDVARGALTVRCPVKNTEVEIRNMLPSFTASVAKLRLAGNELKIGKELGRGAFGSVSEAKYNDETVAVKQVLVSADQIGLVMQELLIMGSLVHPNILGVRGYIVEPSLCIVMDLAQYGDLNTYMRTPEADVLPETVRMRVALDIASAMNYVHTLTPPLIHRDLKSPNVLIMSLDPYADVVAKLSDFGLSCRVVIESHRESARTRAVGNPTWLAPEVTRGEPYSLASDVYSFGLLMWELFSRTQPFVEYKSDIELEEAVQAGVRPTPSTTAPADFVDLMKMCWAADTAMRPTFAAACRQLKIILQRIGGATPGTHDAPPPLEKQKQERSRTFTMAYLPTSGAVPATSSDTTVIECHLSKQLQLDRRPQCLLFVEASAAVWVGCREGYVLVLNAENGNLIAQLRAHVSDVTALEAVSGGLVVSASVDGMLKFWHAEQREEVHVHTSNPWLRSSVPDLTQSDSAISQHASINSTMRGSTAHFSVGAASLPGSPVLNVGTKNGIRLPEREGKISLRVTSLFAKSWKPRNLVLSVRHAGSMQVFEEGKLVADIHLNRTTLDLEPMGEPDDAFTITTEGLEKEKPRTFLFLAPNSTEKAAWTGAIRLTMDLFKSDPLIELVKQVEVGVPVTCLELIDKDDLVVGTGDGRLRTFSVGGLRVQQSIVVNEAHRPVACLLHHKDALWVGVHQSIVKYTRSTGEDDGLKMSTVLEGHQSSITCIKLVDEALWSGSADGELRRWDVTTGTCIQITATGMPRVFTISSAGSVVWVGGTSTEIYVYSKDGKRLDTAARHKEAVISLVRNSRHDP